MSSGSIGLRQVSLLLLASSGQVKAFACFLFHSPRFPFPQGGRIDH